VPSFHTAFGLLVDDRLGVLARDLGLGGQQILVVLDLAAGQEDEGARQDRVELLDGLNNVLVRVVDHPARGDLAERDSDLATGSTITTVAVVRVSATGLVTRRRLIRTCSVAVVARAAARSDEKAGSGQSDEAGEPLRS
jgi:hypothetical protein